MKRKICLLVVFSLLFASIMPAYASAAPSPHVVKPNGTQLNDVELEELKGELAPWVVGGLAGGLTDATLQAVDNILNGTERSEILEDCDTDL